MGNSKQRKAGEMSGGKLRNPSFQEKKGAEAGNSKYGRRELTVVPPPSPSSLKRRAFCFQGYVCHLPLLCLCVIFACLRFFSFDLFLMKKRRSKLC